jgi:hypothetical protein
LILPRFLIFGKVGDETWCLCLWIVAVVVLELVKLFWVEVETETCSDDCDHDNEI